MKLAAGNPALKVNKTTDLGTFAITLGDKAQRKKNRPSSVYVHTPRDPDLVPAPQMDMWSRGLYVPEKQGYQRPGADDHLKFKSKGNRT